ncbi:MAG: DUF2244 domain-containing protein [Pseudomonadota bacterium]
MDHRNNISDEHLEDGPPVFAARLLPHRSLSRQGFILVMIFVAATCLTSGVIFMIAGAWPVLAFMGLDVLIIWLAFALNYRSGRASEEIAVWPHDVLVRQISPSGRIVEHRFNPFWTRFSVNRHDEIGITRMHLHGQGRDIDIGSFLNPPDRESFAAEFGQALATVKAR